MTGHGGGGGAGGGGGGACGDSNVVVSSGAVIPGDNSMESLLSKASSSVLKSMIVACINNPIGLNTAHLPNSSI